MKAKKLVLAVAAILSMTTLFACAASNKKTALYENWKYQTTANSANVDETLVYDVVYKSSTGMGTINYSLDYKNGSYTTHLKKTASGDYEYTTSLTIDVVYTFGETSKTLSDKVETKVVFDTKFNPKSAEKSVVSNTPNNITITAIEGAYSSFDFTVSTVYEGSTVKTTTTYYTTNDEGERIASEPQTASGAFGQDDYTYVDNEMVWLALRACANSNTSGSFESFSPFLKKNQQLNYTFSEKTGAEFSYTFNGTKVSTVEYRPVSLVINDKNPGATQMAWIATTAEDATKNVNRNVILQMSTPLSYYLGELVYDLKSVQTLNE